MPFIFRTIDQIAVEKGRDVVFVTFEDEKPVEGPFGLPHSPPLHMRGGSIQEILDDPRRMALINWLDGKGITHESCFPLMGGYTVYPWNGTLYIDVPQEESNPLWKEVETFLEVDGQPRDINVKLWVAPLNICKAENEKSREWI
jgi:hypothetical protein